MKTTLYSIEHAPRALPIWPMLITDLGSPPPRRIAKVLGLSTRTINRYNRTGKAPRSACLALFWLTRWGRSQVNTQAENDAQLFASYAQALKSQNEQLQAELQHIQALSGTPAPGAAQGAPHALPR